LSRVIGPDFLRKIVVRINALEPDLVLIGGDLVSEDTPPRVLEGMIGQLRRLRPRYGAFAITGNHEYFFGAPEAVAAIEAGGVRVLEDEAVPVADAFYVAGRKDRTGSRFGGKRAREILGLDRRARHPGSSTLPESGTASTKSRAPDSQSSNLHINARPRTTRTPRSRARRLLR
jgi:predicted MPP superfamily phosphohydrolase